MRHSNPARTRSAKQTLETLSDRKYPWACCNLILFWSRPHILFWEKITIGGNFSCPNFQTQVALLWNIKKCCDITPSQSSKTLYIRRHLKCKLHSDCWHVFKLTPWKTQAPCHIKERQFSLCLLKLTEMYEKKPKVIPCEWKILGLGDFKDVNAIAETCLQQNVPWCLRDSVSEENVPGFNLQKCTWFCLQQLYRMDDPGINAQHVDNRVGLEGTQVWHQNFCHHYLNCFVTFYH